MGEAPLNIYIYSIHQKITKLTCLPAHIKLTNTIDNSNIPCYNTIMYTLSNQYVPKQLGILTPSDTSTHLLYQPPAKGQAVLHTIIVSNTSNSGTTFRLFIDVSGTTYTTATAQAYDAPINANSQVQYEWYNGKGINSTGSVAVRSGASNALTFTLDGVERIIT